MIIAITRLEGKDTEDAAICRQFGHTCYTVSPLRAEIRKDRIEAFASAVNHGEFDCLFFTSALPAKILGPRIHRWPRVVAIGPQTARMLAAWYPGVETLPSHYSRDFVPTLGAWLKGKRVGIPRADVPNPDLLDAIRTAGGIPVEVRCYTLTPTQEILNTEQADALLFTSAGSFRAARWNPRPGLLLIAIGEVTAAVMKERGSVPEVVGNGSLEGTLEALNRSPGGGMA
jgi:uroporphyrinogen-III synthase